MSLDATNDDVVYRLRLSDDPTKKLIILPYSMETNDISLCLSKNYTGTQYGESLVDYVECLSRENRKEAVVVCFGLHTFIVGTPGRAMQFEKALERMKTIADVCFMNCSMLHSFIGK